MKLLMKAVIILILFAAPLIVFSQQGKKGAKTPVENKQTNVIVPATNQSLNASPIEEASVPQTSKPESNPQTPALTPFSLYLTYGGGSMAGLAFYYRFTPAIRLGIGAGYTPSGAGNSGVNILVSGIIDIVRLDVGFMSIDLSIVDNLLFFSDTSAIFSGIGPAVFLQLNSFPLISLGILNEFYFRDSGPVYQMGISLGFNF